MNSVPAAMLYVTAGSRAEALAIARTLVEEKLAACCNVLGDVTSIYRWKGALEEGTETLMIAKTRKDLVESALARVRALHSYEVPCAVAYDMAAGLPAYLDWIADETM